MSRHSDALCALALAAYKASERIVAMETDLRGAAGKLGYPHVRRVLAGNGPLG